MIRSISPPRPRLFSSDEYHKLADLGFFQNERVELIGGEIVELSPQNSIHSACLTLVDCLLRRIEAEERFVRVQLPLDFGPATEPEPDISVVAGQRRDYLDHQPTSALLIVEISESSLEFDRTTKFELYASASIPEYWILNLKDRVLEVYRKPNGQPFESGLAKYDERIILKATDNVSPLFAGDFNLPVAEMLPR